MTKALVEDKPDFVQFFLDSGLELEKVITPPQLLSLYEKVSKQNICLANKDVWSWGLQLETDCKF